jgi:hypothetical protein
MSWRHCSEEGTVHYGDSFQHLHFSKFYPLLLLVFLLLFSSPFLLCFSHFLTLFSHFLPLFYFSLYNLPRTSSIVSFCAFSWCTVGTSLRTYRIFAIFSLLFPYLLLKVYLLELPLIPFFSLSYPFSISRSLLFLLVPYL